MKKPTAIARILAAAIAVFATVASSRARADDELHEFFTGARAHAMGNAFVALADDEEAIFYNPAGLAGVKKYTFHYLVADLAASTDTYTHLNDYMNAASNPSGQAFDKLVGLNAYGRSQFAPLFLMPGFGFGIVVDGQFALRSQDQALPQFDLGYQTTTGVQAAYGFSVFGTGRGKERKTDLRFGFAGKALWRRGGYHILPLMTLLGMSRDTLSQITGNYGLGLGVDMGTQYIYRASRSVTLMAGMAYTDIGDTTFGQLADPIKGNLSAGVAVQYQYEKAKITSTFDYRHMLTATDWRRRMHLGLELAFPVLSIFGGINQTYLTYGVGFDVWIMRLTALSYGEELGAFAFQNEERRWGLNIAMKFDL